MKELYLAGGSYYGLQEVFSRMYGVVDTVAGFCNCDVEHPTKEMPVSYTHLTLPTILLV